MRIGHVAWSAVVCVALAGAPARAQSRPDFSGTWRNGAPAPGRTPDPSKHGNAPPAGKSGLTISQRDGTLTLSDGRLAETYALDGSSSTCQVRISGTVVGVPCRATWKGRQLVMEYTVPIHKAPQHFERTIRIGQDGALETRTVITGPNGSPTRVVARYQRVGAVM